MASVDVVLCLLCTWVAYSLRLEQLHLPSGPTWLPYWLSPLIALPVFVRLGLYRAIFRHTDLGAIKSILKAVGIYMLIFCAILVFFQVEPNPRSLGVVQPVLLGFAIILSRLAARSLFEASLVDPRLRRLRRRLLIVGAHQDGVQLSMALQHSGEYRQIGFADDDPQLIGQNLMGHRVFALNKLRDVVQDYDISDVVIALAPEQQSKRREVIALCEGLPVHIQNAALTLDSQHTSIRELDVDDLLGRTSVPPNVELLNAKNHGRVVLVTGAGGSIGSELCRQLLATRPAKLVLLDHSEFALYSIEHELAQRIASVYTDVQLVAMLGDVKSAERMGEVLATHKPHTVYHAAAYKHVPLVELNPFEGLSNNLEGTWVCAQQAQAHGVQDFVLISTDKAVRPTNVMGASKRLAELALQALASAGSNTRYCMVRFGNVLGSSGSVVPLFRRQIAQGGPVTITDPRVTRFFMTIPEAAQLVIQACAMAKGGDVFVLDMGEPIRILDLAHRMIRLAGYSPKTEANPQGEIVIEVTGLRPGEKLYEELLIGHEPRPTEHPKIMRATEAHLPLAEFEQALNKLRTTTDQRDLNSLRQLLLSLVEGYQPEPGQATFPQLQTAFAK